MTGHRLPVVCLSPRASLWSARYPLMPFQGGLRISRQRLPYSFRVTCIAQSQSRLLSDLRDVYLSCRSEDCWLRFCARLWYVKCCPPFDIVLKGHSCPESVVERKSSLALTSFRFVADIRAWSLELCGIFSRCISNTHNVVVKPVKHHPIILCPFVPSTSHLALHPVYSSNLSCYAPSYSPLPSSRAHPLAPSALAPYHLPRPCH